jgi:hypothetical protein
VHLSKVAAKIPSQAKLTSVTRRLSRPLANPAIRVRDWYAPIARQWLAAPYHHLGEVRRIVDGTKIGFGHQWLIVCLAYRQRAIPITWTWVKHTRGHSTAHKQLALLAYVRRLLPPGATVLLVGDAEFGAVAVLRQVEQWGWYYGLRQRPNTRIWVATQPTWRTFGSCICRPGQSIWLGRGYLTGQHLHMTHLLVHWAADAKMPWYLVTNLPKQTLVLAYYRRRMWVEEMFGDCKRHGFDLESTMLRHFQRLSRLTLAVALRYVWLISVGGRTVRSGLRHLVDRADRRDWSIFQIGLRFIERQLINALPIHIPLVAYQ